MLVAEVQDIRLSSVVVDISKFGRCFEPGGAFAASHLPLIEEPQISSAAQALQVLAGYDRIRLESYRAGESLHSRIQISQIGNSHLLRFDDVGYFNRIYAADAQIGDHLDEIERFYAGSPFHCELITEDGQAARFTMRDPARGWTCCAGDLREDTLPGWHEVCFFSDNLAPSGAIMKSHFDSFD